jgi:predicted nucleotidyltransferase
MDVMDVLREVLCRHRDTVLFAYLFGSLAEGRGGPLSDVDVAAFLTGEAASGCWDARLALQADFCRALGRNDVDVLILNEARNLMLLDEIIRRGVVLLDQDRDVREEFELKVLHLAIDFKTRRAAMVGF